jgi:hypothetical protein
VPGYPVPPLCGWDPCWTEEIGIPFAKTQPDKPYDDDSMNALPCPRRYSGAETRSAAQVGLAFMRYNSDISAPYSLQKLFRRNVGHIEDNVSERVILEVIALNSLENDVRELRRLVLHTIFSSKRDGPLFAVNLVRDKQIVVNG